MKSIISDPPISSVIKETQEEDNDSWFTEMNSSDGEHLQTEIDGLCTQYSQFNVQWKEPIFF